MVKAKEDIAALQKEKEEYDGGAVHPEKAKRLGLKGPFHTFGDGSVIPLAQFKKNQPKTQSPNE